MTNQENLLHLLDEWFDSVQTDKPHFWTRDPVGQIIKSRLQELDHWKPSARGKSFEPKYKESDAKIFCPYCRTDHLDFDPCLVG